MTEKIAYRLRAPASDDEWRTYHASRRKVLFENRGVFGVYDERHPDEFAQGNHPMLLIHEGEPIGVIRVDVDGPLAIFRRVAIRDDVQRCGHGKVMLSLAEQFVRGKGCSLIRSYVNPEAVGFYKRCGFNPDTAAAADEKHVLMYKKCG
jgi:GNAT superfamily N-acetyltransferase